MSTKIGSDGKPYDPSQRAREALFYLRSFLKDTKYPAAVSAHLSTIADRLQTCDALEHKLERLEKEKK